MVTNKTNSKRRTVLAGIAAAAGALTLSRNAIGAPTVIRIGTSVSGNHPENIGARKIKELVEERSNGELKVEVFTDGQIGDQRTMVENLRNGVQEVTWVTVGFFGSYDPILNVVESGYLFRDSAHSYAVFDGPFGSEVRSHVEKHGVKLLLGAKAGAFEKGRLNVTSKDGEAIRLDADKVLVTINVEEYAPREVIVQGIKRAADIGPRQ